MITSSFSIWELAPNQQETVMSDSHITAGKKITISDKGQPSGPVSQSHRNKLGEANGTSNPNGVGEPSKASSIGNGNKGW